MISGVSSTPLRKKYIKGFKELTKAHGKSTIAKLTHSKNSDRAVLAQNELAQHTAQWYMKANKYAKEKRYDKEYQALYMLMCYFAQKQNVLSWKVRKAHEEYVIIFHCFTMIKVNMVSNSIISVAITNWCLVYCLLSVRKKFQRNQATCTRKRYSKQ